MADQKFLVANTTPSAITLTGGTPSSIPSGQVVLVDVAAGDTTGAIATAIEAGLVVGPGVAVSGDTIDNLVQLVEKGAFKLGELAHPVLSGAADTSGYANKGLNPGSSSGFIAGGEG